MNIETCLLDMDGVLVDFPQGALDVHDIRMTIEAFYLDHKGKPYMQEILGMPSAAFWKPMNEEFWAKLEWMPDGERILEACERRFGRENIVLASTPCLNYGCWDGKRRWIERHLPKHYHKIENQMFGSRKYLMSNENTILVDDFDSNVDKFAAKRGGHVCPVPRLWNRLHPLADQALSMIEKILFEKKAAA